MASAILTGAAVADDADLEFWRKLDRTDAEIEEARQSIIWAASLGKPQPEGQAPWPEEVMEKFLKQDREARARLPRLIAGRARLVEEARVLARPDGDHFANPLLDERLVLELYRFLWRPDGPDVIQQRKKVAKLDAELPPVSPRDELVHVWKRIILAESGADDDWRPGDDTPTLLAIVNRETTRKLRLKSLREYLVKVREQLKYG